jgi:hypothetical protein
VAGGGERHVHHPTLSLHPAVWTDQREVLHILRMLAGEAIPPAQEGQPFQRRTPELGLSPMPKQSGGGVEGVAHTKLLTDHAS